MKLVFVIILIFVVSTYAGLTASMQRSWNSKGNLYLFSLGYIKLSLKEFQYYEGGVIFLPSSRLGVMISDTATYYKDYLHSVYGVYGGYYLKILPIFRPGILIGTTLRDNSIYKSHDNSSYFLSKYTDFRFDYYIAFSLHAGIFSFLISNYGIGGGLNFMF